MYFETTMKGVHVTHTHRALTAACFTLLSMITMCATMEAQVEWKDRYVTLADSNQKNQTLALPSHGSYTIVVWEDYRNGESDIYAQKIDNANGIAMWFPIDGVPVCRAEGEQRNPQAVIDLTGNLVITWEDFRDDQSQPFDLLVNNAEIRATRLMESNGEEDSNWPLGGICVAGDGTYRAYRPRIAATIDGVFITWTDRRNGNSDVYLQYILSATSTFPANFSWMPNGILVNPASNREQLNSEIAVDSLRGVNGRRYGAVVAYEGEESSKYNIMMVGIDSAGDARWSPRALKIATTGENQHNVRIAHAGLQVLNGNDRKCIMAVWEDERNMITSNADIYAQLVDIASVTPVPQWPSVVNASGIPIVGMVERQLNPVLMVHNSTAAVVWEDRRNANVDIYANEIDISSQALAASDGVEICTEAETQQHVCLYDDGANVWIGWEDWRGTTADIYYQKLGWSGFNQQLQQNGWPVTLANGDQTDPKLGNEVFVFTDTRRQAIMNDSKNDENIYAQTPGSECNGSTNMAWRDEFSKWTPGVDASEMRFALDAEGNTYVVWREERRIDEYSIDEKGIYAQKLDKDGVPRWKNNGVYLNYDVGAATATPDVCIAGNGAALFAWQEGTYIATALVDAMGNIVDQQQISGSLSFTTPRLAEVPNGVYLVCLQEASNQIRISHATWTNMTFTDPVAGIVASGITDPRVVSDGFGGCYMLGCTDNQVHHRHFTEALVGSTIEIFQFGSNPLLSAVSYDVVMDTEGSPGSANAPYDVIVAATNGQHVSAFRAIWKSTDGEMTWPKLFVDCTVDYGALNSHVRLAPNKLGEQPNEGCAILVWDNYDYSPTLGDSTHSVETNRVWVAGNVFQGFWNYGWPLRLTSGSQKITKNTQPDIACVQPDSAAHFNPLDDHCLGVVTWRDDRNNWCGSGDVIMAQFVNYRDPSYSTSRLWGADGLQISPQGVTLQQEQPQVEVDAGFDGDATFMCHWLDTRTGSACVAGIRLKDVFTMNGHDMQLLKDPCQVTPGPCEIRLEQSYPNPVSFKSGVSPQVIYSLSHTSDVEIRLYDVMGRCLFQKSQGFVEAGSHTSAVPAAVVANLVPGVYRYELTANSQRLSRFMVVIR